MDSNFAKNLLRSVRSAYGLPTGKTLAGVVDANMPDPLDRNFPSLYAAWSLLRKWQGLPGVSTDTLTAKAWEGFRESEAICKAINDNGGTAWTSCANTKRTGERIIFYAIRKIGTILGDFSYEEFLESVSHSGGASTQRTRRGSSIKNKWADKQHVTANAAGILNQVLHDLGIPFRNGQGHPVTVVLGDEGFTVDKDSRARRLCFKGPQGNVFLQKGVGKMIRTRLRAHGIDLNDQTVNQRLCADLRYATIDLSNASNRIALETVRLLLQQAPEWLYLIEALRSPIAHTPSGDVTLQMCSGMGNGFTFELESLLFFAVASACRQLQEERGAHSELRVSVYGDDTIVPAEDFPLVCLAFNYCGWSINKEKSFSSGPFRESCGKHYWNGTDVTPVYIKTSDFTNPGDWYHLFNSLNALLGRVYNAGCHSLLIRLSKYMQRNGMFNYIPSSYSIREGVHAPFEVALPVAVKRTMSSKLRREGLSALVYREVASVYETNPTGSAIAKLFAMNQRSNGVSIETGALTGAREARPGKSHYARVVTPFDAWYFVDPFWLYPLDDTLCR